MPMLVPNMDKMIILKIESNLMDQNLKKKKKKSNLGDHNGNNLKFYG